MLHELKRIGVMLALDDFGTGYSSLTYLNRFPIDIVKIDQSFVARLGRDSRTDTIVGSIIDLAHKLGMTVTAEGVETVARQSTTHITRLRLLPGLLLGAADARLANRPKKSWSAGVTTWSDLDERW